MCDGFGVIFRCDVQDMRVFSGNANIELAEQIAALLGKPLGSITVSRFADGASCVFRPFLACSRWQHTALPRGPYHPSAFTAAVTLAAHLHPVVFNASLTACQLSERGGVSSSCPGMAMILLQSCSCRRTLPLLALMFEPHYSHQH